MHNIQDLVVGDKIHRICYAFDMAFSFDPQTVVKEGKNIVRNSLAMVNEEREDSVNYCWALTDSSRRHQGGCEVNLNSIPSRIVTKVLPSWCGESIGESIR